ncbi:hypothetical protein DERP_015335 [Dermatophagoides pteronyssinus]|uniref:Uncharacterized protein n=1 Tax=Dermatophagoides pteronyssinus TaxID=6956 RepID=A0ABQ8IRM3_DERPT|nr:hypothetical protein DERP_015335 [Dermatophagoides pteronyssinus]
MTKMINIVVKIANVHIKPLSFEFNGPSTDASPKSGKNLTSPSGFCSKFVQINSNSFILSVKPNVRCFG